MVLYGAVIPSFDTKDTKKDGKGKADNDVIYSRDPSSKKRIEEFFDNIQ